jgi:hypothetical protein
LSLKCYNTITQLQNSAYLWKDFSFDIDFTQPISYLTGDLLEVPLQGNTQIIYNSVKAGDALYLNNLFVGTASVYDFSGQYFVDNVVASTSSYIKLGSWIEKRSYMYTTFSHNEIYQCIARQY